MRLEELELELMECARNMRRMSARTALERTSTPHHRQISESSLALQDELHGAIEQGHNSTRLLQSAIASLQQQLQQGGGIRSAELPEQWSRGAYHRHEMEDEVERWKGRCRTLEDELQRRGEWAQLGQIENDRQSLRNENADLRLKLEHREKELNGWKEDCMFFAVKFMSWGPSLLKWGPALHHEFERKLLQKRKKKNTNDNIFTPDRNLKIAAGSLRSTFTGKSAVAVDHRHPDLLKGCSADDHTTAGSYSWATKLWSSKKRKCVSCSTAIMSGSGSPSNREFQR